MPFNQTHTFVMSTLLAPRVSGSGLLERLADNNQLGLILTWNSGLPFNIRSNLDLNLDGLTNDRPLGIDRNTGRFGQVVNLDARYERMELYFLGGDVGLSHLTLTPNTGGEPVLDMEYCRADVSALNLLRGRLVVRRGS